MSKMIHTKEFLKSAADAHASDLFIIPGRPLSCKVNGVLTSDGAMLTPEDTAAVIGEIYDLADHRSMQPFLDTGDDDFSFSIPAVSRFRVNTYRQRGSLAAVIRIIPFGLPSPDKLGIPNNLLKLLARYSDGMVLMTGPAGSGKSTTLACLVDYINANRQAHIITLEDPIEFIHRHKQSIVSQREIATDTDSYLTALRSALRQSPDVILLGEMRDRETIQTAITAAETGHLLLSSLHTPSAADAISRIIDVFEPSQQHQVAMQLSMVLRVVVSQQLVPTKDGQRTPAFEIMTMTPAIRNLIRNNNLHQIEGTFYASAKDDMISMDNSLLRLYKTGRIDKDTALRHAANQTMLLKKLDS